MSFFIFFLYLGFHTESPSCIHLIQNLPWDVQSLTQHSIPPIAGASGAPQLPPTPPEASLTCSLRPRSLSFTLTVQGGPELPSLRFQSVPIPAFPVPFPGLFAPWHLPLSNLSVLFAWIFPCLSPCGNINSLRAGTWSCFVHSKSPMAWRVPHKKWALSTDVLNKCINLLKPLPTW